MEVTSAKRRVLEQLKQVDGATVAELAVGLDLTDMAVRLHLREMASLGWVEKVASEPKGRGRPAARFRLTGAANALFEDRHADLTVDLVAAVHQSFGTRGLDQIIAARGAKQVATYRRLAAAGSLEERLHALARVRSQEGYRAEARAEAGGSWLLIEHHCPICEAAKACAGLCASELEVFRAVLGDVAEVDRVKHLLGGDRRCVYRITSTERARRVHDARSEIT